MKKIIYTLVFFIVLAVPRMEVFALSDLLFSSLVVKVATGDEFDLDLSIDPHGDSVFTSVIELKFDKEVLELVSFKHSEKWMPLVQPKYNLIDNELGVMIKTAGYPKGFKEKRLFGTVRFRAKKDGISYLKVGDNSISIGTDNIDTFSRNFPTAVVRVGKVKNDIPDQLFDINLELDQEKVTDIKDMVFRVLFISFGKIPTPVDLTFTIQDELGNEIHSEKAYVVVETEQVLEKRLKGIKLKDGNYKMILKTLYNEDVEDEFEGSFRVVTEIKEESLYENIWLYVLIVLPLIIVLIEFVRTKRKRGAMRRKKKL